MMGTSLEFAAAPFLCFLRHTQGDVLLGEHKIAGSAQRRAAGAVLQHGSVLLSRSAAAPELPGIEQLAGRALSWHALQTRWLTQLMQVWPVRWRPATLEDAERRQAEDKVGDKFGHSRWTERR